MKDNLRTKVSSVWFSVETKTNPICCFSLCVIDESILSVYTSEMQCSAIFIVNVDNLFYIIMKILENLISMWEDSQEVLFIFIIECLKKWRAVQIFSEWDRSFLTRADFFFLEYVK